MMFDLPLASSAAAPREVPRKLTVVISQFPGKHPIKRALEVEFAAQLMMEGVVDVAMVPHLYDMPSDHTGLLFLKGVNGPLIVLSWLYPRATRWTLDRQGISGRDGEVLLIEERDEDEDEPEERTPVASGRAIPDRRIYCIDLRVRPQSAAFLEEIRRIVNDHRGPAAKSSPPLGKTAEQPRPAGVHEQPQDLLKWITGQPQPEQLERYLHPTGTNGDATGTLVNLVSEADASRRRWYPVIDYDRCTNCMECIDFCLFGVYGVDTLDRILVEAQDNCKKGCPACSRVCPENAIVFPQHKSSAIAGADGEIAGLKIDLSQLFGGSGANAVDIAVNERDAELVKDGREAVGTTVGLAKRRPTCGETPRNELDDLIDGLDSLDL